MNADNKKTSFLGTPLKTSFTRVAAVSVLSVGAFIGGTMYGLPMLPGRALTDGEKELLETYFEQSIDYEDVKVSASPIAKMIAVEGFDVFTIGNTIFYTAGDYRDDFSKVGLRGTFIHEATHIWQNQNCQKDSPFKAMFDTMRAKFGWSPEDNYNYELISGKDLTEFHAEHQASIVADYDRLMNDQYLLGLVNGKELSTEEKTDLYQDTLKNFLKDPSYPRKDCWHPF